jgi:hypothetical protein
MTRVFAGLASAHVILSLVTAVLGLFPGSVGQGRHILLGTITVLLSCLIQVTVFTYLTVTFKYASQVAHIGRLSLGFLPFARSLKRSATRMLGLVFALNLLVTASGAAHWRDGQYAWLHISAAGVAFLGHMMAYYREFDLVYRNARMVSEVLRAYEARRRPDGTPVE